MWQKQNFIKFQLKIENFFKLKVTFLMTTSARESQLNDKIKGFYFKYEVKKYLLRELSLGYHLKTEIKLFKKKEKKINFVWFGIEPF